MKRERTRSAMSVKRKHGERMSGHAPFGWDFGLGGQLVENVREQKIIARMRRMQAEAAIRPHSFQTMTMSRMLVIIAKRSVGVIQYVKSMRSVTWVVVEEIRSGDWGIGGNPLTTGDVKALAAGKPKA